MSMKVEIIKRETIKPSSPTAHHLRNFKLSRLDQYASSSYISIALFYSLDGHGGGDDHKAKKSHAISRRLKESLSEILSHFYPLAGRIKGNVLIDCNDDGVDFLEARVNRRLQDILEGPEAEELDALVPIGIESTEAVAKGCVLLVQASFFHCGGVSIGISISHRITDAAALCTFIKAWATATATACGEVVVRPEFNIAVALFPPPEDDSPIEPASVEQMSSTYSSCKPVMRRRFVFNASKIALLKTKAASGSVLQPTRVEAVLALLWKCALKALDLRSARPYHSVMSQEVNLRKRVAPPLPENSFGNIVGHCIAWAPEEIELQSLVGQLRRGMKYFYDNCADELSRNEHSLFVICEPPPHNEKPARDDLQLYVGSSCCRIPIYEAADFGWGKPTWLGMANLGSKNVILLMDGRDGEEIEAWVNLSEEDMALFERDQELLAFASLNPSVLNFPPKLDMMGSRI